MCLKDIIREVIMQLMLMGEKNNDIDVQFSLGDLKLIFGSLLSPGAEGAYEVSGKVFTQDGGVNKHGAD